MDLGLRNAASLFGSPASPADPDGVDVVRVDVSLIDPFPDHPFRVDDDADMDALVESVRSIGVRSPLLARRAPDGRWLLVSGHRRLHAARRAGLDRVPVIPVDLDDDQATVLMVDSNLTRSRLRVSEKARALGMRHRALLHQGRAGDGGDTRDRMAGEAGLSGTTVARLVRLDRLGDDLLRLVDEGRIPVRAALHLSDLDGDAQAVVSRAMADDPSLHVGQRAADEVRRSALEHPEGFDEALVASLCGRPRLRASSLRISSSWIPGYVPADRMDEWVRRACEMLARHEREEAPDGQE